VNSIIAEQYSRALEILKSRIDVLKRTVKLLLEKETLDGDDLKRLAQAVAGQAAAGA
jgi:ATP-dependent Zn protease